MTIKLYHTTDAAEDLQKNLTSESAELNAVLRDSADILKPVLRIQKTVKLSEYNYLQIVDFGRYYYITDIIVDRTGLSDLICTCDVLMSHAAQLLRCPCIFDRTSNADRSSVLIPDSMQRLKATKDIDYYNFPLGLTYPERILLVCNV